MDRIERNGDPDVILNKWCCLSTGNKDQLLSQGVKGNSDARLMALRVQRNCRGTQTTGLIMNAIKDQNGRRSKSLD